MEFGNDLLDSSATMSAADELSSSQDDILLLDTSYNAIEDGK